MKPNAINDNHRALATTCDVPIVCEARRGCGFRKPGALYLRTDAAGTACGKFPLALHVCPTCGAGIKFSMRPSRIDPSRIIYPAPCVCAPGSGKHCACDMDDIGSLGTAAMLVWIGARFYRTPEDFAREAAHQGISRRIASVPHWFRVGETWVFTAHVAARVDGFDKPVPAIIGSFRPDRIEYVCRGTETPDDIARMRERGITPIIVVNPTGDDAAFWTTDDECDNRSNEGM